MDGDESPEALPTMSEVRNSEAQIEQANCEVLEAIDTELHVQETARTRTWDNLLSKFENSEDNVEDDVLEDLEMVVEMVGEEEEWAIAASNEAAEEDNLPQPSEVKIFAKLRETAKSELDKGPLTPSLQISHKEMFTLNNGVIEKPKVMTIVTVKGAQYNLPKGYLSALQTITGTKLNDLTGEINMLRHVVKLNSKPSLPVPSPPRPRLTISYISRALPPAGSGSSSDPAKPKVDAFQLKMKQMREKFMMRQSLSVTKAGKSFCPKDTSTPCRPANYSTPRRPELGSPSVAATRPWLTAGSSHPPVEDTSRLDVLNSTVVPGGGNRKRSIDDLNITSIGSPCKKTKPAKKLKRKDWQLPIRAKSKTPSTSCPYNQSPSKQPKDSSYPDKIESRQEEFERSNPENSLDQPKGGGRERPRKDPTETAILHFSDPDKSEYISSSSSKSQTFDITMLGAMGKASSSKSGGPNDSKNCLDSFKSKTFDVTMLGALGKSSCSKNNTFDVTMLGAMGRPRIDTSEINKRGLSKSGCLDVLDVTLLGAMGRSRNDKQEIGKKGLSKSSDALDVTLLGALKKKETSNKSMSLLDMARQKRSARLAAGATPAGSSDSKGGERLFSKSGKHKAPTTAEEIFTQAVSPVAPVVPYQQQRPPKPQQPQYPYPNHPSYPSSNNPNQISLPHPCQSDNPALMANHLQHTVSDIINQLKQSDGKYDIGFTYDFFVRPQKVSESEQRRLDEEKRKKDKILMKIQRQEKLEHERLEQEIRKKVKRDQESQEEERREQEKRDQEWWEQEKRDRERREQVKRDQERRNHQRQEQGRKLRELEEQKWKEELESIDLAKRELELKEAKLKLKKREKDRKYEEKMKKQQDEKKDQKRRDLERRDLERQDQLKRDQELEKREQERRRDYENHQRELRKEELQSSNPESSFYQPKKRGQGSPRKDPTAAPQWSNADISRVAALEAAYLAVQEQDVQERNKRGRPRKYPVQQVFHPIKIEAISLSSDDDFEN